MGYAVKTKGEKIMELSELVAITAKLCQQHPDHSVELATILASIAQEYGASLTDKQKQDALLRLNRCLPPRTFWNVEDCMGTFSIEYSDQSPETARLYAEDDESEIGPVYLDREEIRRLHQATEQLLEAMSKHEDPAVDLTFPQ